MKITELKITELKIAPKHPYRDMGSDNPLLATVKLSSDHSIVETVLNDDDCRKLLELCSGIIAEASARNMEEFTRVATAINGGDRTALISETSL